MRPVLVKFCQRKKSGEVLEKKKELKKKKREVYINEDLTPLRASLLKLVKEHCVVKNAVTSHGKILAWYKDKDRPITVNTPDDLYKLAINIPDWKRLKLDHLIVSDD